jgi:DNA adenine methylase
VRFRRLTRTYSFSEGEKAERKQAFRPTVGRLGGKSRVASEIVARFPKHEKYVEPMVGGGSVLVAKPRSKLEVISDKDPQVIRLFTAAQQGVDCFGVVQSQDHERELITENSPDACKIHSKLSCSFGKKGFHPNRKADYPCKTNWPPKGWRDRLHNVRIQQGDYKAVMRRNDSPDTLFYLDPPYHGTKNEYGPGLDNVNPEEVKEVALAVKGQAVISFNDVPLIRELFCKKPSQFTCHEIAQPVLATSKGAAGSRKDLVIIKKGEKKNGEKKARE